MRVFVILYTVFVIIIAGSTLSFADSLTEEAFNACQQELLNRVPMFTADKEQLRGRSSQVKEWLLEMPEFDSQKNIVSLVSLQDKFWNYSSIHQVMELAKSAQLYVEESTASVIPLEHHAKFSFYVVGDKAALINFLDELEERVEAASYATVDVLSLGLPRSPIDFELGNEINHLVKVEEDFYLRLAETFQGDPNQGHSLTLLNLQNGAVLFAIPYNGIKSIVAADGFTVESYLHSLNSFPVIRHRTEELSKSDWLAIASGIVSQKSHLIVDNHVVVNVEIYAALAEAYEKANKLGKYKNFIEVDSAISDALRACVNCSTNTSTVQAGVVSRPPVSQVVVKNTSFEIPEPSDDELKRFFDGDDGLFSSMHIFAGSFRGMTKYALEIFEDIGGQISEKLNDEQKEAFLEKLAETKVNKSDYHNAKSTKSETQKIAAAKRLYKRLYLYQLALQGALEGAGQDLTFRAQEISNQQNMIAFTAALGVEPKMPIKINRTRRADSASEESILEVVETFEVIGDNIKDMSAKLLSLSGRMLGEVYDRLTSDLELLTDMYQQLDLDLLYGGNKAQIEALQQVNRDHINLGDAIEGWFAQVSETEQLSQGRSVDYAEEAHDFLDGTMIPEPSRSYEVSLAYTRLRSSNIKSIVFESDFIKELLGLNPDDRGKVQTLMSDIRNGIVRAEKESGIKIPATSTGVHKDFVLVKHYSKGGRHRLLACLKGGILKVHKIVLNCESCKSYARISKKICK